MKKLTIAGWIMTILPSLLLFMSAYMKFTMPSEAAKGFEHLGISSDLAFGLGILELTCTVIYLFPQTSILGAILLTGYLGGATCTHLRVGDPFIMPVVLGVVIWAGIFFREPRLRVLIPLRRTTSQ